MERAHEKAYERRPTMWPWALTFDLQTSPRSICHSISGSRVRGRNKQIMVWETDWPTVVHKPASESKTKRAASIIHVGADMQRAEKW